LSIENGTVSQRPSTTLRTYVVTPKIKPVSLVRHLLTTKLNIQSRRRRRIPEFVEDCSSEMIGRQEDLQSSDSVNDQRELSTAKRVRPKSFLSLLGRRLFKVGRFLCCRAPVHKE